MKRLFSVALVAGLLTVGFFAGSWWTRSEMAGVADGGHLIGGCERRLSALETWRLKVEGTSLRPTSTDHLADEADELTIPTEGADPRDPFTLAVIEPAQEASGDRRAMARVVLRRNDVCRNALLCVSVYDRGKEELLVCREPFVLQPGEQMEIEVPVAGKPGERHDFRIVVCQAFSHIEGWRGGPRRLHSVYRPTIGHWRDFSIEAR
jgi:hypothetical protein